MDKGYDDDTAHKIKLVTKVKKQLEEQKRGFVSKRVPYSKMADFIIQNYREMSGKALHEGVTELIVRKQ